MKLEDIYTYALLAGASYVAMGGSRESAVLVANASTESANRLPVSIGIDTFLQPSRGEPWTIAYYHGADVPAAIDPIAAAERSGFAATLFTRGAEKVLALRGSDDALADLLRADVAQIGVLGIAVSQTVAMVNLLERLRGPAGSSVAQLSVHASLTAPAGQEVLRIPGTIDTYLTFERSAATGLGLIAPGERVTFTGHSLGGELAAVAALLYPELTAPDVYLFNAAGLNPDTADASALRVLVGGVGQAVVSSLLAADLGLPAAAIEVGAHRLAALVLDAIGRALGKSLPQFDFSSPASAFGGLSVHQVRSEDLAPGDDRSVVASAMTGANLYPAALDVTTEANSHVLAPLTDSLALHALFAGMDARFDVTADSALRRLHDLIASASNDVSTSEERLVEALYELFIGTPKRLQISDAVGPTDNPLWTGQGSLAAREDFHAAVLNIRDAARHHEVAVVDTNALATPELAARARDGGSSGMAMRFALVELNPFAIDGADYARHAQDGRLDRYDALTGTGSLSAAWIDDRSAFLEAKTAAYAQDSLRIAGAEDRVFHDIEGDIRIELSSGTTTPGQAQRYTFGSDRGEDIDGGGQADHLYGMGGSDRIEGGGGSDAIEGGAGADLLRGGDGVDMLQGMQGDDLLDGGLGNDRLDGGVGFDTYVVRIGEADGDRIRDVDGRGRLVIDSGPRGMLTAGGYFEEAESGSGVWHSADGALQLTLDASGYSLQLDSGERIAVDVGSLDAALGIHRVAANAGAPSTVSPVTDLPAQWLAASLPDWIYQEWAGTASSDRLDYAFYRPEAAPAVSGRAGRYVIAKGDAGDDWLESNDDFDVLYGEAGADTLISGRGNGLLDDTGVTSPWSGADFLYGGEGDDALFSEGREDRVSFLARSRTGAGSGARGDWLAGGSGSDRLMAGDRDDVLSGGEAGDVLMAGRGNDVIVGDSDYTASVIDWSLTRTCGSLSIHGASFGLPVGNGSDEIHAGSGDDYADGELGDDVLYGEEGDDWLEGGAGEDFLDGGVGQDELRGGGGGDALFGGTGDDRMFGGGDMEAADGDDWLDGQDGNDALVGSSGADRLQGGAGNDELFGDGEDVALKEQGGDALYGEDGADFLRGYGGDDLLDGGAGDDELQADAGADTLRGGTGGDWLFGGSGEDTLDGGDDDDALAGEAGSDTLTGGDGLDTLVGGEGNDRLNGGASDDKLDAGAGDDIVDGGDGADIVSTGLGHDVIVADAQDRLFDEDGDVELVLSTGIASGDLVPVTVSEDGVTYSGLLLRDGLFFTTRADAANAQTRYRFADGRVLDQTTFLGQQAREAVESEGSDGADVLVGYGGSDVLDGRAGDDVLSGQGGDDTLTGAAGDDVLKGGEGNDRLMGGFGADRYRFASGDGYDVIDERGGVSTMDTIELVDIVPDDVELLRESGGDLIVRELDGTGEIRVSGQYADPAQGVERIVFANGVVLTAEMMDMLPVAAMRGSEGADRLVGTARDDRLEGLAGNDVLDGGEGEDVLNGGAGEDAYLLQLGSGRDTVVDDGQTVSHIVLDPALRASDLTATMQGGDVRLGIRGHGDALTIRGYALQSDRWVIDAADGSSVRIDAVLARMGDRDVLPTLTAKQDYRLQATSQIAEEFLGLGYRFTAPDTLVHDPFAAEVRAAVSKHIQHDVTEIDIVRSDGTHGRTQQVHDDTNEQWDVDVAPLLDGRVTIVSRTLTSDAREIVAGGNWQQSDTATQEVVAVDWRRFDRVDARTTVSRESSAVADDVTHTLTTTTTTSTSTLSRTSAIGIATGFSNLAPTTDVQPVSARATVQRMRLSAFIEEVKAGDSDNTISGDFTTLVDAGGGNDVVSGAGFQDGGAGNDVLSDGAVLIGGAGDDRLYRGASMEGGTGNDVLHGGAGETVFRVRPTESGTDLLADDGDARTALQRWLYQDQLRIDDWALRRDEAGGFLVTGPLANRFDADTIVVRADGSVAGRSDALADADELLRYVAANPAHVKPILPLPPLPVDAANDFAAMRPFIEGNAFEQDVLELPSGVTLESLQAGLVDVLYRSPADERIQAYRAVELQLSDSQRVRIVLPHADDPLGFGIEQLRFSDGHSVTVGEVVSSLVGAAGLDPQSEGNDIVVRPEDQGVYVEGSGYAIAGRAGDDRIGGSRHDDDLSGDEGDDSLSGGEGNDILWGGQGDDVLEGDAGDDHLFGMEGSNLDLGGAGVDHVQVALGSAAVDAGEGDDVIDVLAARAFVAGGVGDDVIAIDVAGSVVALNVGDGHDRLRGDAGLTISVGGSAAPMSVARGGDDLLLAIGSDTSATVESWFADAPGRRRAIKLQRIQGDVATYDLGTLVDGLAMTGESSEPIPIDASLPGVRIAAWTDRAWGGDAAVHYAQHGALDASAAQAMIEVVADDAFGVTAQRLMQPLAQANHAPALAAPIPAQRVFEDDAFVFVLPAGTFSDADPGDRLTFSVTRSDGTSLPGWLTFDGESRLVGTPSYFDIGDVLVRFTATDTAGQQAYADMSLSVQRYPDLVLQGGAGADTLIGHSGNDLLDGGAGGDTMRGARGDDAYRVDDLADVVIELANEGVDTVQSSVSYTLPFGTETLQLLLGANTGTGNAGDNTLRGNETTNVLRGLAGDDAYWVGTGDSIVERAGEGRDTVYADITWSLSANVETLQLIGDQNVDGSGNALNNLLMGNDAANTLDGGAGEDELRGGNGDDVMLVNSAGDIVVEAAGGGNDTVRASVSYALPSGVESLVLMGTGALTGVGNALDNRLRGNAGNNTLSGGAGDDSIVAVGGNDTLRGEAGDDMLDGGAGDDAMFGGAGDDRYMVGSPGDSVHEDPGEGIDAIVAPFSYRLGDNVEALFLSGGASVNGAGNAVANLVVGNTAANTLDGGRGSDIAQGLGGADVLSNASGNDLLDGGAGADRLSGSAANELLIGGAGNDTLAASGGFNIIALNAGDGKDVLTLTPGATDALTLGGDIRYADLALSRTGNDLLLRTSADDQIAFKDWYLSTGMRTVKTLQVVVEGSAAYDPLSPDVLRDDRVETFSFAKLTSAFERSGVARGWSMMNALLDAHLGGSDDAALGGDLAYRYGLSGALTGVGLEAAQQVLDSGSFAQSEQVLRAGADVFRGAARLA